MPVAGLLLLLQLVIMAQAQGSLGCFAVVNPPPAAVSSATMTPSICINSCSISPYALIAPSPVDDTAYWCICQSAMPSAPSPVICEEPCSSGASICGGIDLNTGRIGWSAFAVAAGSTAQIQAPSSAAPVPVNSSPAPIVISDSPAPSPAASQPAVVVPAVQSTSTRAGLTNGSDFIATGSSSSPTMSVNNATATGIAPGTLSSIKAGTQPRAPPAAHTTMKNMEENNQSNPSTKTSSSFTLNNTTLIGIIAGGSTTFLAIIAVCGACCRRRRSQRKRASITDVLSLYTIDARQSRKPCILFQQQQSQPYELPGHRSQVSEGSFATTVVAPERQTRQSTFSAFSAPFSLQRKPSTSSSVFRFGAPTK
ncbi:hypothetical protein BC830DRAFT_1221661 [Chytriomyces sp. MP71]|nr:hypothetical protein BC830DRAFT_1221661 [Chytriomyces sp. MP71]